MAICISNSSIVFGGCSLSVTPTGFSFAGTINAPSLINTQNLARGNDFGYVASGEADVPSPPAPAPLSACVDRFPFATDTNATCVGELTASPPALHECAGGAQDGVCGYMMGGNSDGGVLRYFIMASGVPASGQVTGSSFTPSPNQLSAVGQDNVCGVTIGGSGPATTPPGLGHISTVSFASGTGACIANYSDPKAHYGLTGSSNVIDGVVYAMGGRYSNESPAGGSPPYTTCCVQKFLIPSATVQTSAFELGYQTCNAAGNLQSGTDVYVAGGTAGPGSPAPGASSRIEKIPFASDSSSCIGALTTNLNLGAGLSSTTHGYITGQFGPICVCIQKFPFASDSNATDVGDLSQARRGASGHAQ